jgi:16S rRNA processing protein RimM
MAGTTPFAELEALPADAVEVGRIIGAWGIKGWVRVQAFAAQPEALFSCRQWLVGPAGAVPSAAPSVRPAQVQRLRVAHAQEHAGGIVAQLHEVNDRTDAESLKGSTVWVPRSAFPTPGADEYYWVDLIGLAVVNRDGLLLGTVAELFATGPQSVLRVLSGPERDPTTRETLIPFVSAYVDEVQMTERRILVDWGLDF